MKQSFVERLKAASRRRVLRKQRRAQRKRIYTLGVLAIMKNEEMGIQEWLDHYFWIGADRIYLIDNGSTDNSVAIVKSHPMFDKICLVELPQQHQQLNHYRHVAVQYHAIRDCEWLMLADLDEYWFCKDGRKIPEALNELHIFDVIYANWTMFGAHEGEGHPSSLRKELLRRRPKLDRHEWSKWICRTSVIKDPMQIEIHKIFGANSGSTISANDILQLNHYSIQSREFFEKVKMTRGDAVYVDCDNMRDWSFFKRYDDACTVTDTLLRELVIAAEAEENNPSISGTSCSN